MEWYVLQVRTMHELEVRDALIGAGYEAAVPRELRLERRAGKWHYVGRTLFPGYVFVRCVPVGDGYYAVRNGKHVLRVLGAPTPLTADEAAYLAILAPSAEPLATSRALQEGENIRITGGPLAGLQGLIRSVDRHTRRCRVAIPLLGEEREISMSLLIARE